MSHLLVLALVLSLLACGALGAALLAGRRSGLRGLADPIPGAAAGEALPPSVQEAAMLEALCQDIRARTNGIVGLAELLLAARLPEDQLRQAELIADSGRTMLRLLGDVLDVTRIDAGGLQLQAEPSDLRDMLGHSANLMQASARAKGLSLVLMVDDAVPRHIMLDRARLRQVMLNLIGNAVKFTQQGRIDVQARLAHTATGAQLAISVIDPGVGIARERQGDVFQPFYRNTPAAGCATPAAPATGTGLGLALSSRLVRAMGGEIVLESAPGLGSCFTVRLPLVSASGEIDETPALGIAETDPERLVELQARYRLRKEALFASLHTITTQSSRPCPEDDWTSLTTQLQRLGGIAANFGDVRLGNLARDLHAKLRNAANPRLRHEVVLRHLDDLLAAREL